LKITKENFIHDIEKFRDVIDTANTHERLLNKVFYGGENKLYESVYTLADLYIDSVAALYGIDDSALSWFIYETDFGRSPLKVSKKEGSPLILIDSIELFWDSEKND